MRQFTEADLDDLAVGAAILGTGGGGNPYVGKLLARAAIREYGPVTIVDVDEVPDDALVVPSAMMGAPTVIVEKLPSGEEAVAAFAALQDRLGRLVREGGGVDGVVERLRGRRRGRKLARRGRRRRRAPPARTRGPARARRRAPARSRARG